MWGTTLAVRLARRVPVTLLVRTAESARALARSRENPRLPGVRLPDAVSITANPAALEGARQVVIVGLPCAALRSVVAVLADRIKPDAVIVSAAKGLEKQTLRRMTEVLAEEIPAKAGRLAALSGPNLALEIARGLPAAAVVAAPDDTVSTAVAGLLEGPDFRLYRSRDVVGVELAGALKNVIAIAAGAAEQLGLGDNAKAALVTRGLAEMTRLGIAAGAHPLTFAGLAGLGDIVATCWSPLSRNHRLGAELAGGRRWTEIEASLPGVAEGAYTVVAALGLAARLGVELPIARQVHAAIYEGKPVAACIAELMGRSSKDELESLGHAAGVTGALPA
jgi:glycerol-3-phosphate dehydrogenase (NAD(P)+)